MDKKYFLTQRYLAMDQEPLDIEVSYTNYSPAASSDEVLQITLPRRSSLTVC